ncbi:MAG: FkbM family methyltransferase [Vicinamibacterales bacterium]
MTLTPDDVFVDGRFASIYSATPLVLADIGARGGLRPNWAAARRHLRLLGFEPDEQEFSRLAARAQADGGTDRFFGVALHNRPGPVTLHVARDRGLSSIFEPNRPFLDSFPDADRFDSDGQREVECETLDRVLDAHGITDVDFIKADTQGSELLVLQGARAALSDSVVGVEVEVEFSPIYKDQPLFPDVDAFLRGMGYMLFDLRSCYWKRREGRGLGGPHGQIMWADALYFRSVPALRAMAGAMTADARKSKVLRAMSVALLYGYADYALEIARQFPELWSSDERQTIDARLSAFDRNDWLPMFPGRRHLALAFRRLWKSCQPRTDAWSVSDSEVGNLD